MAMPNTLCSTVSPLVFGLSDVQITWVQLIEGPLYYMQICEKL